MTKKSSIKLSLIVLLTLVTTDLIGQRSIKVGRVGERVLATLDAEFNESFAWWARVYDGESGGCFYSLSAKSAAPTDRPSLRSGYRIHVEIGGDFAAGRLAGSNFNRL